MMTWCAARVSPFGHGASDQLKAVRTDTESLGRGHVRVRCDGVEAWAVISALNRAALARRYRGTSLTRCLLIHCSTTLRPVDDSVSALAGLRSEARLHHVSRGQRPTGSPRIGPLRLSRRVIGRSRSTNVVPLASLTRERAANHIWRFTRGREFRRLVAVRRRANRWGASSTHSCTNLLVQPRPC